MEWFSRIRRVAKKTHTFYLNMNEWWVARGLETKIHAEYCLELSLSTATSRGVRKQQPIVNVI